MSNCWRNWRNFIRKAGDEKSGIKSTTELYLYPYSADGLRELFGYPNPTLDLSAVDQGRSLRPSIPQSYLTQRRYVIAWFKFAGYYHLLRRFDEFDEQGRASLTPIVLVADALSLRARFYHALWRRTAIGHCSLAVAAVSGQTSS